MAGNDLKMNHLSYDVAGFDAEFKKILNLALNHLSARVADIFKREINANSEASQPMKNAAIESVREISRKITDAMVELEVGVDEAYARGKGTEFFVKTMASIYGNLKLGNGKLFTKPGKQTWRKHVTDYHTNTFSKEAVRLEGFEQKGHSNEMVQGVLSNVMQDTNKYVEDFINMINSYLTENLFGSFIQVR